MAGLRKHNKISGQFAARLIELIESPAYRVLSLSAHRVLSRLEIELAHHGGHDNGRLPVTFENFQNYGIDRHAIAPAIRECVALGFVVVTEPGRAGNAEFRSPNLFRLTYKHCKGLPGDGTHDWRKIETIEEAQALARKARPTPSRNQNAGGGKCRISVGKSPIENAGSLVGNSPTTPIPEKSTRLSISPGGIDISNECGSRSAPPGSAVASERHSSAALTNLAKACGRSPTDVAALLLLVPDAHDNAAN
jgi:hypothetical protein